MRGQGSGCSPLCRKSWDGLAQSNCCCFQYAHWCWRRGEPPRRDEEYTQGGGMKPSFLLMIVVACLTSSIALSGMWAQNIGSRNSGREAKLIVEKGEVTIMGFKTDTAYSYSLRQFAVTLRNSGTSVANDIRISVWPVFTDTLRIKLFPKEHYTKTIDTSSGELYLTVPVLGEGESLQISFADRSLPASMPRTFKREPLFPRFFLFHASCMRVVRSQTRFTHAGRG